MRIRLTHINDCSTIEMMILELGPTSEPWSHVNAGGSFQRTLIIHALPPSWQKEESGRPSSRPEFGRSPVGPPPAVAPRGRSAELDVPPFFGRPSVGIVALHRSP